MGRLAKTINVISVQFNSTGILVDKFVVEDQLNKLVAMVTRDEFLSILAHFPISFELAGKNNMPPTFIPIVLTSTGYISTRESSITKDQIPEQVIQVHKSGDKTLRENISHFLS